MNINYDLVIYILEFINFEMLDRTKPFASDILLNFEDGGVNEAQYAFLKGRLDSYNLYIDREYSMTYETQYDESEEILSMGIIISIPDRFIPEDQDEFTQLCMVFIERFQKFYERSIQFFNNKNKKESDLNPSYLLS
jgi:hypothetical protein